MRTPQEILNDIVTDVNEMQLMGEGDETLFGPFDGMMNMNQKCCVQWPNLYLLVKEAETALKKKG